MGDVTNLPLIGGGPTLRPPEPISGSHDTTAFDCGKPELDDWLKRRARKNEGLTARTYVVSNGNQVVGFYCLATGAVERGTLPKNLQRNTPDSIPVVIIGRLAVNKKHGDIGIGKGLLKDAILRALSASREIGIRAIIVHAIDDEAVGFYKKFGFLESPLNIRTLVLPLEFARAALS